MYAERVPLGTAMPMAQGSTEAQGLLQGSQAPRYPGVPTTATQLVDSVESGGAKVEETLSRLNCRYQTLFFVSSLGVIFAAVIGSLSSFATFQLANCIDCIFLCIFGLIMLVLDIPGTPRWTARHRQILRKYIRFLTRLTGRSIWFLFLGCLTACALWPTNRNVSTENMLIFIAIVVSFFVVGTSIMGILIAIRKSLRLERVRKIIQMGSKGSHSEVYRKYAVSDPQHGMHMEEFNRMCADYSAGKLHFDVTDLGIIYNALDETQKNAVNEKEFGDWMIGAVTYL